MLRGRPVLASLTAGLRHAQRAPMTTVAPNFSPGSDAAALGTALDKLVSRSEAPWHLTPTGEGVERSFRFKTFAKTWVSALVSRPCPITPWFHGVVCSRLGSDQDFMTAVSLQCKLKNHHPEWSNVSSAATGTTSSVPGCRVLSGSRSTTQPSCAGRPITPRASQKRTSPWLLSATTSRDPLGSRQLRARGLVRAPIWLVVRLARRETAVARRSEDNKL